MRLGPPRLKLQQREAFTPCIARLARYGDLHRMPRCNRWLQPGGRWPETGSPGRGAGAPRSAGQRHLKRRELPQGPADIGQGVPVLTGSTIVRRSRRLAGVGDRIPELAVDAVQRLCGTDPGPEQRRGSNGGGGNNGDGRTDKKISHRLILPDKPGPQTPQSETAPIGTGPPGVGNWWPAMP